MKKAFVFLALLIMCVNACIAESGFFTKTTAEYFNTISVLSLSGVSREQFNAIWEKTNDILEKIEKSVSLSIKNSEISRFNALDYGEEMQISPMCADIIKTAFTAFEKTDGLYDPCVYPLVDLWGFSYRFNKSAYKKEMPYDRDYVSGSLPLPEEKYVKAFLNLMDFSKIELTQKNGAYYIKKNIAPVYVDGVKYNARLDFGGIAKGYACDKIIELLKKENCAYGYFICGQSSIGFLENAKNKGEYVLELKKPYSLDAGKPYYAETAIKNAMLSSSVPYSKGYSTGGVSYYHIINPDTGKPINNEKKSERETALCNTVIASNAALCDAFTTGICLMDEEMLDDFLQKNSSVKAIAVFEQGDIFKIKTNMDKSLINILDYEYIF